MRSDVTNSSSKISISTEKPMRSKREQQMHTHTLTQSGSHCWIAQCFHGLTGRMEEEEAAKSFEQGKGEKKENHLLVKN